MKNCILLTVILWSLLMLGCSKSGGTKDETPPAGSGSTFYNPVLNDGPDPWVLLKDNYYYYVNTEGNKISLRRTSHIDELKNASFATIWTAPSDPASPYSSDVWAPEIHFINGKWYIYFTAQKKGADDGHRLFVLENDSDDPMVPANWEFKGKLSPRTDGYAIDPTVFTYKDISYIAWAGDDENKKRHIYIARLSNPYTIEGDRIAISRATFPWEGTINEGPEALLNPNGQLLLTYSGNSYWTVDYCLGLLTLKPDGNPLNPADWTKKDHPVFTSNISGGAVGPGHNGFFKSPDGKEDWIIYHAYSRIDNEGEHGVGNRSPRIQKFAWNSDGTPNFGAPVSIDDLQARPSGE